MTKCSVCGQIKKGINKDKNTGMLTCYDCRQQHCRDRVRYNQEKGPKSAQGSASSGYIHIYDHHDYYQCHH